MRRISLALALIGAVAVTGCSSGSKPASTDSGALKGTYGQNFYVNLFAVPIGGTITSADGRINCGASSIKVVNNTYVYTYYGAGATLSSKCGQFLYNWTDVVVLTATPQGGNSFVGWAGDCRDAGTCNLDTTKSGNDKTVVGIFGGSGVHPSFQDPAAHGPSFAQSASGDTARVCEQCHGSNLAGNGMAPSCFFCHNVKAPEVSAPFANTGTPSGPHGDNTLWTGHNTNTCARCHTTGGFRDYIGADGTADDHMIVPAGQYLSTSPWVTQTNVFAAGPLQCNTCHNAKSDPMVGTLNNHMFASGKQVTTDGATAVCIQCHDGGRPGYNVAELNAVLAANSAVAADNQLTASNKAQRAHYLSAASTFFGADAAAWYQYPNQVYTSKNQHGVTADKCTSCHDPHGQKVVNVTATSCGRCHFDESTGLPVTSLLQIEDQRQYGFEGNVDGTGVVKGLPAEIANLGALLYTTIQAYAASNIVNAPICTADNKWYAYGNTLNACGTGAGNTTAYTKFTPRLLKASFNYLFFQTDKGAWAHNPRYTVEILFDTIWDLNAGLRAAGVARPSEALPVLIKRSFEGHFGSSGFAQEPYAQFLYHPPQGSPYGTPGTGFTSASCYQCHGGQGGLEQYLSAAPLATNLTTASKVTGMACTTCHAPAATDTDMATLRKIPTLFVPPQKDPTVVTNKVVSFTAAQLPPDFAVCATCHTGLENGASVDNKIVTVAGYSIGNVAIAAGSLTTISVDTTSTANWAANRFAGARVTFLDGTGLPAVAYATASSATNATTTTSVISVAGLTAAPTAGDHVSIVFDNSTFGLGFVNGHYFGAAGIILGADANVLYGYAGKTYQGKAINFSTTANGPHGSPHGASCLKCHNPVQSKHSFAIDTATTVVDGTFYGSQNTKSCDGCHTGPYALAPAKANLVTLGADLLTAMQAYGTAAGKPICYSPTVYPYFLKDTNANGTCDGGELSRTNGYLFDATLLKAAYNYQWFVKDPGAAEHNYLYIGQVLYDAIGTLGGTTTVARP